MHVAVAPRTVLPSTAIVTSLGDWLSGPRAAACPASQAPMTASTAAASVPVTIRR